MFDGMLGSVTDEESFHAQAARYGLLTEVVLLISRTADLNRLLKGAMAKLKWVMDFERCTLALLDEGGQTYELRTLLETRRGIESIQMTAVPVAAGCAGYVFKNRKIHLSNDLAQVREQVGGFVDPELDKGEIQTLLCIPLEAYSRVLGVISFATVGEGSFSDDDIKVANLFSTHLALAIDRYQQSAKLHAEIEVRQRAQEESARLATYPELNPNPIIELDLVGNLYYLNPAAREAFPEIEIQHDHPLLTGLDAYIEEIETNDLPFLYREAQVGDIWYQQQIHCVHEGTRIRTYIQDITVRKKAEEESARLASFPELNPNPIIEVDLDGNIQYINPAAQKAFPDITERKREHPLLADLQPMLEKLKAEGKESILRELEVSGKWFEQEIQYDAIGNCIRTYIFDVTERKQASQMERQLEAHRMSPLGRAEAMAQELLKQPDLVLRELHLMAQVAAQDPDVASMLGTLPGVLDSLNATPLTTFAEGYNYLFVSQYSPELLPVGLRTLIINLSEVHSDTMRWADESVAIFRICQAALECRSIQQITELLTVTTRDDALPSLRNKALESSVIAGSHLAELVRFLLELRAVADALHSYERVETSEDQLSYLASAVERLSRVDRLARADLSGTDRAVIRRITESWLSVLTGSMTELQTKAEIVCNLLTRHTWTGDVITLAMNVKNDGKGAALNIQVSLAPSPEYTFLDEIGEVGRLAQGEEAQVELRVRLQLPEGVDQFRARFVITYTDPRGPGQVENFADVVHLLATDVEFKFISNPYVVGTPLQPGSSLFFGREDIVDFIQQNLEAAHHNNLVLIGQRRTGKTSLLKQLPRRLGDQYLPIFLDGQTLGLDPGLPNFFLNLSTEITFAMEDRGFQVERLPELMDFEDSPTNAFEHHFLGKVRKAIDGRHLLILLDEFEELETAVRNGTLDASIFGFLRHLIQHSDDLSVIFCGTHRLEELAADYWNILFNISLYRHVGYLSHDQALSLIQKPVEAYGMRYDDLALDKMWRISAGHPYFMQLLCHSLVNRHNKTERNYITVSDVNVALEEILSSGEAHFVYLWTESTGDERLSLTALSRMIPLSGQATPLQVLDFLVQRGVNVERRGISEAMHHLQLRDILSVRKEGDVATGEAYHWKLGLLGLWVEKYKSLSRVVDEV